MSQLVLAESSYREGTTRKLSTTAQYTLAMLGNTSSHVARSAAVKLLGGGDIRGNLKSPHVLMDAEYNFVAAQRLLAKDYRDEVEYMYDQAVVALDPAEASADGAADIGSRICGLATTLFKGWALGKCKLGREHEDTHKRGGYSNRFE